jgi:hypothetical protein
MLDVQNVRDLPITSKLNHTRIWVVVIDHDDVLTCLQRKAFPGFKSSLQITIRLVTVSVIEQFGN